MFTNTFLVVLKPFHWLMCYFILQADSALWQQDLDSVHFSCSDESLDFGSPKAQSTQVEARKKRSHRSGKSFKNFNYVGNRNNNSSVEYLGIVTQPSVEHLGSCAPLLNHDSSSSVVIVEIEKKVERDNIPRVITIDSSKEGSNGDHIRLESSGSSPSILKQNEKSDTMSRQSEQKNVMIHIVEVADKGNISPTRENEKEVSINNDCVFQNRTDVHPELSLNFSSDKSVISPSPEAEVSHLSQLSLVGNVSRMVSNRITKSNTEKNALDQSTNAQVELDAKINVHGTSLIASTTEQQSYEREPSLSLRPYTLMQDKSVLNQMFYVQLPSVTQESKTDMSENNSNVEWQDDIAVNSESHYGDSQKDPAEISVEGLFDQRKHVNRMNKLSGHQGCAKVVKENITENSPTDLLIKGDLQDAENELRHSTDTSFENSLEQEKSVLQEYYSQKDSPRCKVNKDSLLDRANSFKTMSRIPVDIQNNDVNTNELGGINVNGQKQNQIRAKTGMSVVNYFKNNKANRSKINTNSLILREKRNKTKTTSARKQKQLTACYKRRKSPRLVKREGTDKSQRVSSHSDKREPLIQKEKESVVHKTGVTSIMSQKGKMNVGYCDVSNSSNKRVKRNTENYDVDDSSSEQSISGDTGDSNKIQNITVRELDSSEDSSLESKKEEKEVDLEMSECPSNLDASFPVRQIIPEPNRNFEKSRNIKQTKPSTEWEANFYEWTKNYKETGCNQYSCLCCQDSNAVASVVVDSSTSTNINSDFTSKNVINMKTVHEQSVSDGSYLDIGNSAHSNSKLSRSETDEGNGLKNSSLNVHISSESKLVERNSELDKSPVMSHKNLENNTLYDSRNITSVKRTIDSANTASDKTRTPIPCATQSDTLERTSYIFRKTSSPKQSNSDESVESAGSPDLLTGTLPFDTEHLMVKPHQEAPMPDILTGTQKFDTVYSQTQGFVPNLSSTLRTLSSSSNELSLLNASEENKTDRLLSPESIPQEARLCSLNKNSVSNIKTQNIMLKRLPRDYSVELEAEQQRLESLSKPGSKGVAIQSEMITATAKNDSMSRLDPLLHENTNDNDIVVISSDSSNETVPDFVVKETGSSVHNKLESLNSNLSTETTAHQTTDNILGEESQHSRYTCGNNKYNSTESEMEVISFVSKNGKSSTDLKIEKEETQKSKCKNIWLSSHFIRQFDLSTVTVIPLKKDYSKEKLQRLSNVKKIYKEKGQHESKTSTLKVKPIYKSNRKTLFERQSSSKSLVELTDESSDTESVVKFDLEKHKNLKTYEPQKMIIDGHNFGNKNMWMNIEKSPYPQLSKLNQKNSQRGTSDFTRKDLPMSGSVHSDASLIGKEGLVRKEVDGMFRFYRKPTQNHTKDSRVNTKDTADKVSKNTSVDTKENGESLQSSSYVTDKRKSRTENHLNHSETVSQRNMKGIVSTSLDKNLGGNEKGMPKKEKEEKGIPELFKCNIDIPEHSTTEGKISNKRKLDDTDGSSTNCKIMRLRTNLHGQKQTTQNDRGTFDLPKQLSHLTDSLFLEDAVSEKRERKKKYMEGLGLRNFFTQEWIEKQAFEVKSSEDSQTSSSQSQHGNCIVQNFT